MFGCNRHFWNNVIYEILSIWEVTLINYADLTDPVNCIRENDIEPKLFLLYYQKSLMLKTRLTNYLKFLLRLISSHLHSNGFCSLEVVALNRCLIVVKCWQELNEEKDSLLESRDTVVQTLQATRNKQVSLEVNIHSYFYYVTSWISSQLVQWKSQHNKFVTVWRIYNRKISN